MTNAPQESSSFYVFQFWNSGLDSAPAVVKSCIESWKLGCKGYGFEHVVIDEESLPEWEERIGGDFGKALEEFRLHARCWPDAKWRRYSDMLRLALLSKFNGIWADSTLLLTKPLKEWLPDPITAGGLQLCKGVGESIESWFICSLTKSSLLEEWARHYIEYNVEVQRDASQYLAKKLSVPGLMFRLQHSVPRAKRWWFGWVLRKVYRRQPYFAIYYSFDYVLNNRKSEDDLYKLYLPYDLHAWSTFNTNQRPNWQLKSFNSTMRAHLERMPFIKLDWKRSPSEPLQEVSEQGVLRALWDLSMKRLKAD